LSTATLYTLQHSPPCFSLLVQTFPPCFIGFPHRSCLGLFSFPRSGCSFTCLPFLGCGRRFNPFFSVVLLFALRFPLQSHLPFRFTIPLFLRTCGPRHDVLIYLPPFFLDLLLSPSFRGSLNSQLRHLFGASSVLPLRTLCISIFSP